MRFFKVNEIYINLDNVLGFFIQYENIAGDEYWRVYAQIHGECVKVLEYSSEKQAKINLDLMMIAIQDGKDKY